MKEVDYESIDESETTELQDVPIQVVIEQEIEEKCVEEVVNDIPLQEMYKADAKIHTDVKLEMPIIKPYEVVKLQDITIRIVNEQEMCSAEVKIHTDE